MEPKRSIALDGTDHAPLELSKVTQVNVRKRAFHLEELAGGTFLLCFTTPLIPENRKLQALRLVREAGHTSKRPRCSFILEGMDQPPLVVSKVSPVEGPRGCFYLDELHDGTFRLVHSKSLFPDLTHLQALRVVRDDPAV